MQKGWQCYARGTRAGVRARVAQQTPEDPVAQAIQSGILSQIDTMPPLAGDGSGLNGLDVKINVFGAGGNGTAKISVEFEAMHLDLDPNGEEATRGATGGGRQAQEAGAGAR
jgi:hypothetical protein